MSAADATLAIGILGLIDVLLAGACVIAGLLAVRNEFVPLRDIGTLCVFVAVLGLSGAALIAGLRP